MAHDMPRLAENGRYGVALFFAISGYLISTLLLRERRAVGRIDLPRFYGRRALRLLPLYYAALALEVLLVYGLGAYTPENRAVFGDKLVSYLFYFSNWAPVAGPFFFAWSLAAEEQFYLGFGVSQAWLGRRAIAAAAIVAIAVKAAVYGVYGAVDESSTPLRILFSYQEAIFFGVLLSYVLDDERAYARLARWLSGSWVAPGLLVGMLTFLSLRQPRLQSSWDAQLLYVWMTLLVAASVVRRAVPVADNRLLQHVGKISYGIYLLHMFVINALKKGLGQWPVACLLASTVVVVVVATVVHRTFESPIITFYKKRLAPRRAG